MKIFVYAFSRKSWRKSTKVYFYLCFLYKKTLSATCETKEPFLLKYFDDKIFWQVFTKIFTKAQQFKKICCCCQKMHSFRANRKVLVIFAKSNSFTKIKRVFVSTLDPAFVYRVAEINFWCQALNKLSLFKGKEWPPFLEKGQWHCNLFYRFFETDIFLLHQCCNVLPTVTIKDKGIYIKSIQFFLCYESHRNNTAYHSFTMTSSVYSPWENLLHHM